MVFEWNYSMLLVILASPAGDAKITREFGNLNFGDGKIAATACYSNLKMRYRIIHCFNHFNIFLPGFSAEWWNDGTAIVYCPYQKNKSQPQANQQANRSELTASVLVIECDLYDFLYYSFICVFRQNSVKTSL